MPVIVRLTTHVCHAKQKVAFQAWAPVESGPHTALRSRQRPLHPLAGPRARTQASRPAEFGSRARLRNTALNRTARSRQPAARHHHHGAALFVAHGCAAGCGAQSRIFSSWPSFTPAAGQDPRISFRATAKCWCWKNSTTCWKKRSRPWPTTPAAHPHHRQAGRRGLDRRIHARQGGRRPVQGLARSDPGRRRSRPPALPPPDARRRCARAAATAAPFTPSSRPCATTTSPWPTSAATPWGILPPYQWGSC
jgi:hypothetical protein